MRNITFNSTSINSGNYQVRTVKHDSANDRDLFMYALTRETGAELVSTYYQPKKIIIEGIIKGTSADDLETNIDSFKQIVSGKDKVLDIEYASGTRRYVATARIVQIERDYYNISYAPFSVEFSVPEGYGKNTSQTAYTTASSLHTLEDTSLSILGSAVPKYNIQITFSAASSVTQVSVTINGDKITLTNAITAGQVVVIDAENKKVTLDGTEKDYTGLFPKLVLGSNTYKIVTTSTSHTYAVSVNYTKSYL